MSLHPFTDLLDRWRKDAKRLRELGQESQARMMERVAAEAEAEITKFQLQTLTLKQAAEESGFSYDSLQRKVSRGEIPNAGAKNRPRVRRADVPVKSRPRDTERLDLASERLF